MDRHLVADWRDVTRYRDLIGIDRAGLMWEWLRRDLAYVAWYARTSTIARGGLAKSVPPAVRDALSWGLYLAEDPAIAAPAARLIWHADLDPGTLAVDARSALPTDLDAIDPADFAGALILAADGEGREHAVISDGWHHIRIDLNAGSLAAGAVILRYRLEGSVSARPQLLSLRRLVDFSINRRFARSLFPPDRRIARWLLALQVHDALVAGATQREIAGALYGERHVAADWGGVSDSLRSRVRRLVSEARRLAQGGWRTLLGGGG